MKMQCEKGHMTPDKMHGHAPGADDMAPKAPKPRGTMEVSYKRPTPHKEAPMHPGNRK